MESKENENKEMPLGLSFTLAMHEDAMKNFSDMSDAGKNSVVEQARQVQSKAEMEALVRDVAEGKVN